MKSAAREVVYGGSASNVVDDVAAMTLDGNGVIRHCNTASAMLFKYGRGELVQRHVSVILPQLAEMELMEHGELNSRLRFLFHTGVHFRAVTQEGQAFNGDIFLNVLDNTAGGRLSLLVRPTEEGLNALNPPTAH